MHYSTFIDCPLRPYFIRCLLINRILVYLSGCLGWDGCIIKKRRKLRGMVKCMCYSNGIMLGINGIVYIYIYIYIIYINPSHICVVFLMSIDSLLLCKNEK